MLLKIKILSFSFISGLLLFLMLCLGANNLNEKKSVNLGINKTVPLPTGFIIGVSIVVGVLAGGSTTAILSKKNK